MVEPEEAARKKIQRNALQINPTGALINTKYLARHSEVVAVNRNDLNDLIQFYCDRLEAARSGHRASTKSGCIHFELTRCVQSCNNLNKPISGCTARSSSMPSHNQIEI